MIKMYIGGKGGGVTVEVAENEVAWFTRAGYKVVEEPAPEVKAEKPEEKAEKAPAPAKAKKPSKGGE